MNYYEEIKQELVNNETYKRVKDYSKNKGDLNTYYNVGKLLVEAGKHYGEGIIKRYSSRLTIELGKGYTFTALTRMRNFFLMIEKLATMSQQLSWSHYQELIPIKNTNKVLYYIDLVEKQNLSVRELRSKIKNKEYERLPEKTKSKLFKYKKAKIDDFIKDPIIIKNTKNYDNVSEKILQQIILEGISSFLKELGEGFSFIDSEYKIKLGDRYNYIDLLLFNYIYNSFVVIELKITELKAEYIGQIKKYMGYIDKNIKSINQNDTIGIIICKKENKFVMEYCSDKRILQREYKLI